MRIRPFFWCLLAFVCVGTLLFAASYKTHTPNVLRVCILQQQLVTNKPTMIKLYLTDAEGIPIESASIFSHAHMTNMNMPTREISTRELGQGQYMVQLYLFMAGPWAIDMQALAEGFVPSQQSLCVQGEVLIFILASPKLLFAPILRLLSNPLRLQHLGE